MIKGLAITPPVLGRISIGRIVEKAGKRLPEKDDQFTLTTQVQHRDGWVLHPLDEQLRQQAGGGKLRAIPVRLLFSDPDLNLRADYTLFDRQNGRPLCVGNGETCRRYTPEGVQSFACPSPEGCPLAAGGACKPFGRLYVRIGEDDELGTFIFRTTGFNSIRTLAARLRYFQAVSGNRLACLPLALRLRGKSTTQSHRAPIYYVDLTLPDGMALEKAMQEARATEARHVEAGIDQQALDEACRQGLANAAFEFDEDMTSVVEEFYSEEGMAEDMPSEDAAPPASPARPRTKPSSLSERLQRQA